MQFQVPQFIEVEDKIFGPLTFRQFVWIGGGLGSAYILYRVLPIFIAAPLILGILGLAGALAFFQWNGRPFIIALENGFRFFTHSKLYLWNNNRVSAAKSVIARTKPSGGGEVYIPKISDSRLHELAWSLDIRERIASGVESEGDRTQTSVMPIRTARDALVR